MKARELKRVRNQVHRFVERFLRAGGVLVRGGVGVRGRGIFYTSFSKERSQEVDDLTVGPCGCVLSACHFAAGPSEGPVPYFTGGARALKISQDEADSIEAGFEGWGNTSDSREKHDPDLYRLGQEIYDLYCRQEAE